MTFWDHTCSGVYMFFKRERQTVFFFNYRHWTLECYIVNKEKFQNNLETVDAQQHQTMSDGPPGCCVNHNLPYKL